MINMDKNHPLKHIEEELKESVGINNQLPGTFPIVHSDFLSFWAQEHSIRHHPFPLTGLYVAGTDPYASDASGLGACQVYKNEAGATKPVEGGVTDHTPELPDGLPLEFPTIAGVVEAVDTLYRALTEDPDFYIGFQTQLSKAFMEAFRDSSFYKEEHNLDVYKIANQAAINFLNQLTKS